MRERGLQHPEPLFRPVLPASELPRKLLKFYFTIAFYLVVAVAFSPANAGSYEDFFSAIQEDQPAEIAKLLQRGFDPNTRDPEGRPGLYVALQSESYRAAQVLLASPQTDVNALNATDESPLMMAALKGRLDWCQRLLERGAQVRKPGWSPLHYAATGPDDQVVALLLDKGADLDALSPNRTTPLMMAARYGTEASVQLLLQRGADPRLANALGLTAADFARQAERHALAEALQRRLR